MRFSLHEWKINLTLFKDVRKKTITSLKKQWWKKPIDEHAQQLIVTAMRELDKQRRTRGIKQYLVCKRIGISTKTYAALMRGECNRLDVFLKISEAMRTPCTPCTPFFESL